MTDLAFYTVTVHLSLFFPYLAVITAFPGFLAGTTALFPRELTLAILEFLEVHVTFEFPPTAVIVVFPPAYN